MFIFVVSKRGKKKIFIYTINAIFSMYWNVLKIQFFSFNIQAVINLLEYLNKLACRASLWDSVKWRPSFSFVWLSSTLSKCNQKREKQGASGAMVTLFYQLHSREKSLLKHISSDFLVHTNVFLKIQNMHTLASLDLNAEHCDSLTVRCLCDFFVRFYSEISILSVVLFPVFTRGD